MFLLKMLFPKLYFGLDDLPEGTGAPSGQPDPKQEGNDPDPNPEPAPEPPTDFIDFKGVKISASDFENVAKERFKDRFEAFDNREKWQAENTRKAQENAQAMRDAEAYRRLMAERENTQDAPTDPQFEAQKAQYIAKKMKLFPNVAPEFFESQFEDLYEARQSAREVVDPILRQQGETFESKFLTDHPKVVKGSPQYQEIAQLIGSGVNPEKAYQIVFHDDILKEKTDAAIKQRDEEAKRKLQQARTQSTPAQTGKLKGREVFESAWDKFGDK